MGLALNGILDRVCSNDIENLRNDIAITWINYKSEGNLINKGFGFGINNRKLIYPASIIKLVYGLAAYSWIDSKTILLTQEISDAVNKMLFYSSNDATSFLIDIITGTTSGPSIEGDLWENWKYQRSIINDWLKAVSYTHLTLPTNREV